MSMTVWWYKLQVVDHQRIQMHKGAKVLSVQVEDEDLNVWALVDPSAEEIDVSFRIAGTGHIIDNEVVNAEFLGTVQRNGLVFHIWRL